MLEKVEVYYDGWGEHWLWGTLVSTKAVMPWGRCRSNRLRLR